MLVNGFVQFYLFYLFYLFYFKLLKLLKWLSCPKLKLLFDYLSFNDEFDWLKLLFWQFDYLNGFDDVNINFCIGEYDFDSMSEFFLLNELNAIDPNLVGVLFLLYNNLFFI